MSANRTVRRLALTTAIAVALSPAAQAATFTVSNADDAGAGSLREAIVAANANPDADTIVFDGTVFTAGTPQTISVATPMAISGPLTLTGPGADAAILDGQQDHRIFEILTAPIGTTVTIAGLTLQNGFDGNTGGGCIHARGVHLVLEDSVMTGCSGGEGEGGALRITDALPAKGDLASPASLIVRDTRFEANEAARGGAVAANFGFGGGILLQGTTVQDNEVFGYGGGLLLGSDLGDIELIETVVSGNTAQASGGGVVAYSGAGTIRVEDSQISNNRLQASYSGSYGYGLYGYGGGAVLVSQGEVLITGTRFENNAIFDIAVPERAKGATEIPAGAGGGLFVPPPVAGQSLQILDSQFLGNSAADGGGVFMVRPQSCQCENKDKKRRAGPLRGVGKLRAAAGGKALAGTILIQDTRFGANLAHFAPAIGLVELNGPPVKAVSPGLTLERVTLDGNLSTNPVPDNPGIAALTLFGGASPAQLINSTLSGNSAGIGIFAPFASSEPVLLLDHTTIAQNSEFGAGVQAGFANQPALRKGWRAAWTQAKDYPLPAVDIAVRNSVLAGNGEFDLAAAASEVTMLHSLVQTTEPVDFSGYDDQGGNQLGVDPLLGPLGLAGHPYLTVHVPQDGSPLIDAGDREVAASTPPATDQRGEPRIAGAAIDIGAVEVEPVPGTLGFDPTAFSVDETAGTATFTVLRTGGDDGEVSVAYSTPAGSATAGADFTAASGTLTWADGDSTAKTFDVTIVDDTEVEADETFLGALGVTTGGATVGAGEATATIVSEDLPPIGTLAFVSAEVSVNEGQPTVTLGVARSGGSRGEVGVDYDSADIDALAGSDYTATSGSLSWADGDTAVKNIVVPIADDALVESPETFGMALSNVTGGADLGVGSATVTIVSDDVPPPGTLAISPTALSVDETAGTATLSVSRSGGSAGEVSVNYATLAGSAQAGSDFGATAGTLNWGDQDTAAKSIVVPIVDDSTVENAEQFSVTLSQPGGGASLGNATSTVTITSEDQPPAGMLQFDGIGSDGIVTLRFNEDGTPAVTAKAIVQISVSRVDGSFGPASIDFATVDGSATAPGDYTATAGTLQWGDGESGARMISVNIVEDGIPEPDEEFRLVLSNAQGAGLGANAQAQIVIVAGGVAPPPPLNAVNIPAGDTRGWLALFGAMLLAGWAGLRRRLS